METLKNILLEEQKEKNLNENLELLKQIFKFILILLIISIINLCTIKKNDNFKEKSAENIINFEGRKLT